MSRVSCFLTFISSFICYFSSADPCDPGQGGDLKEGPSDSADPCDPGQGGDLKVGPSDSADLWDPGQGGDPKRDPQMRLSRNWSVSVNYNFRLL